MISTYLTLGIVSALSSAGRSTWSPCGLSMLSSITPLGERARGTRFAWTSKWFLVGAVAGGVTLGGLASLVILALRIAFGPQGAAGASSTAGEVAVVVACSAVGLLGAATDLGAFGAVLPVLRRQVDDGWMSRLRPWVYGSGFGWQIGFGLATYVMTAGVAVTLALAIAAGIAANSILATLAVCVVFGAARGATIFLAARASTPERLREVHRYLECFEGPVRLSAAIAQAASALVLVGAVVLGGPRFAAHPRHLLWPVALGALVGVLSIAPIALRAARFGRPHPRSLPGAFPLAAGSRASRASRRSAAEAL